MSSTSVRAPAAARGSDVFDEGHTEQPDEHSDLLGVPLIKGTRDSRPTLGLPPPTTGVATIP
jgi:hypothetical protein